MKLKTLALTVAALALLSIVVFLVQRPSAPAERDARVGQPLITPAQVKEAGGFRITQDGKSVSLALRPGGQWVDASYHDLPIDFSKLTQLVDDLTSAKIERLVTQAPERLKRLEFADTGVALLDAGGKPLTTVTLGKSADGGGRFVKYDQEKKGYLTDLSVYLDVDPKNWADSQLVKMKMENVARVEIGFAHGAPVVAERDKKNSEWHAEKAPAGQRIKADSITSLLSSLTGLRFEDLTKPTDPNVIAARQHSRTITLTSFDHQTVTIALGRKPAVQETEMPKAEPRKPEAGGQKQAEPQSAGPVKGSPEAAKPEPQNSKPAVTTVPAGPVYAFITSSDPAALINSLMKKWAFQIYDWNYTNLPKKREDLFEPAPVLPKAQTAKSAVKAAAKPAAAKSRS